MVHLCVPAPPDGPGVNLKVGDKVHRALRGLRTRSVPAPAPAPRPAPLGQRLLLVDAYVEEHGLHPQQHPALDLPGQRIEQGARQRDPHVKAVPATERKRGL